MKKIYLAVGATVMLLLLLGTALVFSATLSNLHVNAASFAIPAVAPAAAAPMTYADESNLASPQADRVRFQDVERDDHICQRDKVDAPSGGF
jgi:hypothetical protein